MTEPPQPDRRRPAPPTSAAGARAANPPGGAPDVSPPAEGAPAGQLTPEEQMALFAKELKENDWGHQPC